MANTNRPTIPGSFCELKLLLIHIITVPVLFLVASMLYRPEGLTEYLDMGRGLLTFNSLILSSILLVTIAISRTGMFLFRHALKLNWLQYMVWCLLEMAAFCLFGSLYTSLMSLGEFAYFDALSKSLVIFVSVLIWPYLLINLIAVVLEKDETPSDPSSSDNLIRFKDDNQRLKLAVTADSVLYIEAKENYVNIVYLDSDTIKKYILRSSMKRLEGMLHSHGLRRCQRAYFVNPSHIKVLRKDSAGFVFADLDAPNCPPIPVSKTYYDSITAMLL